MSDTATEVEVDTNNILNVRRRPVKAQAVQFTGANGKEVAAFVKQHAGAGTVRNGGSYVTVTIPEQGGRARKGDWIVIDADHSVLVVTPDRFDLLFAIKG
jgi:hypothetical protein